MDGSNAAFLFDTPLSSTAGPMPAGGILYIEDFDAPPAAARNPEAAPPSFGADAVDAAYEAGRQEGLQAALADASLVAAQVQAAAIQALADALATARGTLHAVAASHAHELCQTMLAVLHAAVPAALRTHAAGELAAMVAALSPGFACEPELRVRAHPAHADALRETLAARLPETCVLSVCADPSLAEGDVRIAWKDGSAWRDTAALWADITAALAPLALPTLKEICDGCGR